MRVTDALRTGQEVQIQDAPPGVGEMPPAVVGQVDEESLQLAFSEGALKADPKVLVGKEITVAWTGALGRSHSVPIIVDRVDKNVLHGKARLVQNRSYIRIRVKLGLTYERLPDDKVQAVAQSILSEQVQRDRLEIETERLWHTEDVAERLDDQFAQMTRFMQQIDAKLDYLIAVSEGRKPEAPIRKTITLSDISGSGLAFLSDEAFEKGAYLKLTIQLSRFPLSEIDAIGEVRRCFETDGETEGKYDVGVHFTTIHEDDREKIFRFVTRMERKMLRDRKEAQTR